MKENRLIGVLRDHLAGCCTPVPEGSRLAWRWFNDLCRTRTSNGYGPNPISFVEIEAYARLYRWPLEPRHLEMILALDAVWLEHVRGHSPGETGPSPTHGQAMTAAAFDAVFS